VTFPPQSSITALISGFGAGLFCIVVSTFLATFFLLPPGWSFYLENPADVAEILVFSSEALFYVILITGLRLSLERYRDLSSTWNSRALPA